MRARERERESEEKEREREGGRERESTHLPTHPSTHTHSDTHTHTVTHPRHLPVILFAGDKGLRGRRPGFGPLSLRSDLTGHRGLGEQSDQALQRRQLQKIARPRAGPEAVCLLPAAAAPSAPRNAHAPRTPPVAVTAGAGLRADAANGPVGNIRVLNTSAGVEGAPAGPACARPVPRICACSHASEN